MDAIIQQFGKIRNPKTESELTDPNFNVSLFVKQPKDLNSILQVGALIQPANSGKYYSYDGSLTTPSVTRWFSGCSLPPLLRFLADRLVNDHRDVLPIISCLYI